MAPRKLDVRWVTPENLTDEQVAEARERLGNLARSLGRTSARVCHDMGIAPDMDDPEVALAVTKLTFDGLFLSPPPSKKKARRREAKPRDGIDAK